MTVLSDYVSGTISLTTGSVDFTGSATGWLLASFKEGDTIIDITGATEFMGVIAEITSNTAGKLTKAWEGPSLVDAPYRMRYQSDGSRTSAQARNLIELLGDGTLTSLAGLSGPGVIELLPGGGAQVVPKTDLTSGAAYDVQVANLAARAAYDGQAAGFAVLVANVGDGRSAIYSKASNASGDWSAAAYVTGPVGPTPEVTIGTVTTGAPGTNAEVTATPTDEGVELDFTIPAGEGFSFEGAYNGATAYAEGDVVRDSGSSWIALQATTGNAPPTYPTTSNAYWALIAAKGQDGTGTGDVVGPAGTTDGRLAAADGTTGKQIKFLTAAQATATLNAVVGDSGSGGTKGLVPAPAAGDAAAGKVLRADGVWAAPPATDTTAIERNQALMMAGTAKAIGSYQRFLDMVGIGFKAAADGDASSSGGAVDTTAGCWKPGSTSGAARFPTNMTSNTAPAPFVASSLTTNGQLPWQAFDNNAATYWQNDGTTVNDHLKIDLGASGAVTVATYSLTSLAAAPGNTPASWKFQGSNDNAAFVDLDTRTGITFTGSETKTFTLASVSSAYRYFRLLVSANGLGSGNYTLSSFTANGPSTTNNAVLVTPFQTADAARTRVTGVFEIDPVDAITLGTDLTVEFTCNGGANWAAATTYTNCGKGQSGRTVIETDLVTCTSGTSFAARVKNLNNKKVDVYKATLRAVV